MIFTTGIPTIKKILTVTFGMLLAAAGAYHLIGHEDPYGGPDYAIAAAIVLGVLTAFPEPVIDLVKAYKGTTPS